MRRDVGSPLRRLTNRNQPYPNVMVGLNADITEAHDMTARTGTSTMHIGELAERTGLSLRTIRHYDDVGLLPATARTEGGFRVYSEDDVERLMVIKQMKPLGFSLEEMADILELFSSQETGSAGDAQAKLAAYLEKAVAERAKMARNLAQADQLIERLSGRG
ncbi:hypothetical protein GCM10007175_02070 [Pseudarthrobacter scleromae]|uniref:HTH merR-type domain-containing protein n=2 Tax=Micrococcaceae TaxID=1268 RepID=A0ABQ2CBQ8_9MICC|nr:hypothetical protein GCM10007175_02070 [Pseudarthrobacter scleromae]